MNSEDMRMLAEDILFEAELIPTHEDMSMLLSQEGIRLNAHTNSYLAEIAGLPTPSAEAIAALTRRLTDGDESAKGELVELMMRHVVCAAKRYCDRGVPFSDLLQEGSLGLVGAVESYAASPEGDFGIHAVCGILEALSEAVREAESADEIPAHLTELLQTISHSDMVLEERLGREATPEEIAADTGLDTEEVASVMEIMEEVASRENEREAAENAAETADETMDAADTVDDERPRTRHRPDIPS